MRSATGGRGGLTMMAVFQSATLEWSYAVPSPMACSQACSTKSICDCSAGLRFAYAAGDLLELCGRKR